MTEPASQEVLAESQIKSVTVFESSAQVHRHATVSLRAGYSSIVFHDLPAGFDRDSLQVGLANNTTEGITLRGIVFDVREDRNPNFAAQEAAQAEASRRIEQLQERLKELRDALNLVTMKQNINQAAFKKATSASSGAGEALFDINTWQKLVQTNIDTEERLLQEQRDLEDRRKAIEQELQLEMQIKNQYICGTIPTAVVEVTLVSKTAVESLELVVSYVVNEAWWNPEYEIRVSDSAEVQLQCNGIVHQATPEDWTKAALTFSTARPSLNGRQPEMTPWRIDFKRLPVLRKQSRSSRNEQAKNKKRSGSFFQVAENVFDEELESTIEDGVEELVCAGAAAIEQADAAESATAVSFTVARPTTVLRDGEEVRCPLFTWDLSCTFEYHTVPSLAEAVYATAVTKNSGTFPLQLGDAAIFFNGQYVCTSTVPRTPVNEELRISVGRDESIAVKHKMLNRQRADHHSGMLQLHKKDKVTMSYMTTLKSTKKESVIVTVMNRIPMSDNDDLVVTLVDPALPSLTEKAQKKVQDEGFVDLEVTLSSQQSKDVPLSFTVVSPSTATVYGL